LRVARSRALSALCRRFGAGFIVNDDLALALASDADGVHLGSDDGDLIAARQALGPGRLLGASCYADFEMARSALRAGADYVAFGADFSSPTKPHAVPAPLSLFARCREELGLPVCAIGGITADNAPAVIAAGADMIAVISDLFAAPDIESRAAALQQLFEGERT
jgi:thiamine-phosphate pyrophosphorylase